MKCPNCGTEVVPEIPKYRKIVTGPFETRQELREAVWSDLKAGMTGCSVAEKYGISNATVCRIKHGDKKQPQSYVRKALLID